MRGTTVKGRHNTKRPLRYGNEWYLNSLIKRKSKTNEYWSDGEPMIDQWQESSKTCATTSTMSQKRENISDIICNPQNATSFSMKLPSSEKKSCTKNQSVSEKDAATWTLSSEAKSPVNIILKKKQTNTTKSA